MKATTWVLAALLTITAAAGFASAEANLEIRDLPEAAAEPLGPGDTLSLPFTAVMDADGFGCAQASSFTFEVMLRGAPPAGITATVEPTEGSMSVAPGLYSDPVDTYSGSFDGTIQVNVESVTANATVPLTVVVSFPGGMPEGCQGNALPALEAEAATSFDVLVPEPEPVEEPEIEEPNGIPAPGLFAALGAVGAAVAFRRRG